MTVLYHLVGRKGIDSMQPQFQPYQTASQKASSGFLKFFITCVIIAGVLFSDIIFFQMINAMFPPGIMQAVAIVGALTTGLSVLLLYWGKQQLFRPGGQILASWIFTGIEVLVMIMNDILYFALQSGGHLNDVFMATWRVFCPATPVISVIGWLILVFLDPARAIHHKHLEMHDEIAESEIDYQRMLHRTRMQAKYQAMADMGSHLAMIIQEESQPALIEGARKTGSQIVSSLTNTPLIGFTQARKIARPRVVDADPVEEEEMEEAASRTHTLDPHKVKSQVDTEKKPLEKKPLIDFSLPKLPRQKGKETAILTDERGITEEKIDTSEEETTQDHDPLADSYADSMEEETIENDRADWSLADWRQRRNDIDAWSFDQEWKEYHGDTPFPDDRPKPTPKKAAPAKKKVTRRKVLGMESQDA